MLGFKSFDPHEEYILEDERVLLRPLSAEDWQLFKNLPGTEGEIWKYSLVAIQNEQDLESYFQTATDARNAGTAYAFIVFDKLTQSFVGCTRFYDIQIQYLSTQLGYTWYTKSTWGSGVNLHCKYLLLQFAFEQLGLERVEFRADNDNKRSIAAMQKIGCTIEGILRSHLPKPDGGRRDSIVLSILKTEWNASVKNKLAGLL